MDELLAALADYRRAASHVEDTRAALHRAIVHALASGETQADIVRATGYTRERLRQIARAAGIGAASAPTPQSDDT